MDFDRPPGEGFGNPERRGPERWEEDAIAYIYSEKMRRDDGEEIDDDDLVDAVFGVDRPAHRPVSSPPSGESVNTCAVLLVIAVLAVAAVMCWSALLAR